jgi:hypothetical protein
MSSPYLKSGEFIILTTDRVCIKSVQYEVLLTTRHLILVDIRYAQFQPQAIPLSTILSVKGGKIATGEMVIILSFSDTSSTGDSGPMVLIFSQLPGEQRKRERDEWLKKLMGLIVSVRQETVNTSLPITDEEGGIRPSMRRSVAPEKIPPYTTVIDTRPVPVELTILPEEPESLPVPEEVQELPGAAFLEEDTKSEEVASGTPDGEETPPASGREAGSSDTIPPPEVREIVDSTSVPKNEAELQAMEPIGIPAAREIPGAAEADTRAQKSFTLTLREVVKSLISPKEKRKLPDTGTSSLPGIEETEAAQQEEPGSPDTILSPEEKENVESITVPEEKAELPDMEPSVISTAGEIPDTAEADTPAEKSFTLTLQEAVKSLVSFKEMRELPDTGTSSVPYIDETESAQQEEPGSPDLPTSPEPEVVESPTVFKEDSELSGVITLNAGDIAEPGQQPAEEATPQIPKSPLPPDGTDSQRQTVIGVMAIILVILGIFWGAVFYPQYFATPNKEPVPIPTPTLQQIPQQQTPVQQTPVPTQVVIPTAGVWVRVVYDGNYYGWVGNPGSLQGVNGSGDQIYKIRESDGIVQVEIYKDDNSGNTLMIEIYRNGELITRQARSIPMSSIELLVDAKTGNPPGVTSVVANETNLTGSSGGRVLYF